MASTLDRSLGRIAEAAGYVQWSPVLVDSSAPLRLDPLLEAEVWVGVVVHLSGPILAEKRWTTIASCNGARAA